MQTDAAQETLTPSNNFTVARVRQDFVNRSNIGAVFVNRQGSGSFAGEQDYNRSYAVDGRLGIGQVSTISGFAAGTQTPDVQGDAHAYDLTGRYDTEQYRVTMGYTEVGPNFNPEVGFYSRRGFRRLTSLVFTTFRPENSLGIHEVRPHVSHNTIWNFETGQQESQFTHIDTHWEWQNGYEVHTGLNIFKGGCPHVVRDLSGRDRARWHIRPCGGPTRGQHESRSSSQRQRLRDLRRVLRRRPSTGSSSGFDACRRGVQRAGLLDLQ